MRFAVPSFLSLVLVSCASAALVARQNLPSCATPCLANAATGSCAPTDDTCLCRNQAFINSTRSCIQSSCSGSDLQNAEAFAQQLCLAVGVTLTASSASTTATSTAAPSSTPSSAAMITSRVSVFVSSVAALALAGSAALAL